MCGGTSSRFDGRVIRESSKSESKTVARDAERSRRRELEESYNQIKRRALPPTFERAGSDWLEAEKPHLVKRTYEIYGVAYRCHLKPLLGSLLLCDIDASRYLISQSLRLFAISIKLESDIFVLETFNLSK